MDFITTINPKDVLIKEGAIQLLEPRKSGNIKGVGYRDKLLYVAFGKTVYSYEDVPLDVLGKLFAITFNGGESLGKYFNASVKVGGYKYAKVDNVKLSRTTASY